MIDIKYGRIFKPIRSVFKRILGLIYPVFIKIFPLPKVASIDETIVELVKTDKSICRFGDGELIYISEKRSLPFQVQDKELRRRFKEILNSNDPNILVGLPIGFQDLTGLKKDVKLTWKAIVVWTYLGIRPFLRKRKLYYNASITRLYIGFENNTQFTRRFEMLRSVWDNKDVILIEGSKSISGYNNDLFANVSSLKRILGPAEHAFSRYNEILDFATKQKKSKLFLISLGPAAKPLVFDLAKRGYRAIDIGNLDAEYEWYLMGAKRPTAIPGKYTSEAQGGRKVPRNTNILSKDDILIDLS